MSLSERLDSLTIEQLKAEGSVKWSTFPSAIGAFVTEMDFGVAPVITKALHQFVDHGPYGYQPEALIRELSEATASWQAAQYGWNVSVDDVHAIADVIKGLEIAIEAHTEPGGAVIIQTPAYMPFLQVPGLFGRRVIEVPMLEVAGQYSMDLVGIDAAFKQGGQLLVVCNPANPVGRVFTAEELRGVADVVARNSGRVFADEIHAPLVYQDFHHVPYASVSDRAAEHALTATAVSKAWNLPGLKTAQLILSNDVDRARWEVIGHFAEHGASTPGIVASIAAYRDGKPWLDQALEYLGGNRKFLSQLLAERIPRMGYLEPEGTYIAWLDARALGLGPDPREFFLDHAGVAMTRGVECGGAGAGFLRFIFATPRAVIDQAVTQMAQALKDN